jgi:subtilase family serine protease
MQNRNDFDTTGRRRSHVKKTLAVALGVLAIAAVSACSGLSHSPIPPTAAAAASSDVALDQPGVSRARPFPACPPAQPGHYSCFAILSKLSLDTGDLLKCAHEPECYLPSDLQAAYGITDAAKTGGKGVVIAAVDAYGYPDARSDLKMYRALAGLPPGHFEIVNESGKSAPLPTPFPGSQGWQGEAAVDVDMLSAMCPNCTVLLVQASSDRIADLIKSEKTALRLASVASNSWGGAEQATSEPTFDNHPNKVIVAAGGNDGAGGPTNSSWGPAQELQPCGFRGVICAGGTSLVMKAGQRVSEVVWQDFAVVISGFTYDGGATGSGCSTLVAKPPWQKDKGCTKRAATDISADADPLTGMITVCTPCAQQDHVKSPIFAATGGTSASAPLIASMYGLAGNVSSLTNASVTLYSKGGTSAFHDITSGYNDKVNYTGLICWPAIKYICTAGKGYDGPSGWGTPNGLGAL